MISKPVKSAGGLAVGRVLPDRRLTACLVTELAVNVLLRENVMPTRNQYRLFYDENFLHSITAENAVRRTGSK